ncbi:MAG: hypothetical protein ACO22R_06110 [Chitinophagaceae bacterium]
MSALYLVDRGMQGKHYRWYDAENDQWSQCAWDMQEALDLRGKPSGVDFFPWIGPLTGRAFNPDAKIKDVNEDTPKEPKAPKVRAPKVKTPKVRLAKQRTATPAAPKAPKQTRTVNQFPDGTVWFRADRQKWIAQWNGKQEAARPTAEACLKFLKKKYNFDGKVVQ